MTICNLLAEKTKDNKQISAYEKYDKFSKSPRYEIVISENGFATDIIKAAKTTWKRRFNELT